MILKFTYQKMSTVSLHVSGLIASGDNKLATDWIPAMNPCAFPFTTIENLR